MIDSNLILPAACGDQKFWFVFCCEGKILFHMATKKKKIQSPVGACLKKLISDPAQDFQYNGDDTGTLS